MKVKDIIKKWQKEGVSDDIIRKRLLILRQQTNPPQMDDTQDHELEAIKTQTQISLPGIEVFQQDSPPSTLNKNILLSLYVLLGLNIFCLLIFILVIHGINSDVKDLKEEIQKIKTK